MYEPHVVSTGGGDSEPDSLCSPEVYCLVDSHK